MRSFASSRTLFRSAGHGFNKSPSICASKLCPTDLTLKPAQSSDFGKIGMLAYEATASDDPYWEFCMPGLGRHSTINRNDGMTMSILLWQQTWRDDPDTNSWWKVVDSAGTMISVLHYLYLKSDPLHGERPDRNVPWLPQDSKLATYARRCMELLDRADRERCVFPHVRLSFIATLPNHRRLGAASKSLEHAVALADEKDLPTYVWATDAGAPLYDRFGFVEKALEGPAVNSGYEEDQDWTGLAHDYPFRSHWMERKRKSDT